MTRQALTFAIFAAAAIVAGSLGTWEVGPLGVTRNGPAAGYDAWATLAVGIVLAFDAWRWRETGRRHLWDMCIGGVAVAALGIRDYRTIERMHAGSLYLFAPGWGIELVILAAVAVIAAAIVAAISGARAT